MIFRSCIATHSMHIIGRVAEKLDEPELDGLCLYLARCQSWSPGSLFVHSAGIVLDMETRAAKRRRLDAYIPSAPQWLDLPRGILMHVFDLGLRHLGREVVSCKAGFKQFCSARSPGAAQLIRVPCADGQRPPCLSGVALFFYRGPPAGYILLTPWPVGVRLQLVHNAQSVPYCTAKAHEPGRAGVLWSLLATLARLQPWSTARPVAGERIVQVTLQLHHLWL